MTSLHESLEEIRRLIGGGETSLGVEQLIALLKASKSPHLNEAILHSGRLRELQRKERRSQIGRADADVERARIDSSLLELLDVIARDAGRLLIPYITEPVSFEPPEASQLEKIIGTNNLKSIAWLKQGITAATAICRVVRGDGAGSGFLLSGGRVMTNHHVIPGRTAAEGTRVEFGYEEEVVGGMVLAPTSYGLRAETWRGNRELDYALVEIDTASSAAPLSKWMHVEFEAARVPGVGDHVSIIQHPQGGPKQICLTANQVVNVFQHRLQYTTDTLPGSSGSPVFNDAWRVVAVHHAGGNLLADRTGRKVFANEGVLLSHILKDIGSLQD